MTEAAQELFSTLNLDDYSPSVLVVDSDQDNLRLAHSLSSFNFSVKVSDNPVEALKFLKNNGVDIIISSQSLPMMSGVEFLRKASPLATDAKKIIISTDHDMDMVISSINDAHIDFFLTRPFVDQEFYQAIEKVWNMLALEKERDRLSEENEHIIEQLRQMNFDLESRIQEHTVELSRANDYLKRSLDEITNKNNTLTVINRSLNIQATVDPLTGLFNRRAFQHRLDAEWARYRRHKRSHSLMMLDIDHFKKVNDTYGHEGGDVILQTLSQLMKSQQRRQDLVCRYGGEEFVIILPDTDLEAAFSVAEKLRKRVAVEEFIFKDQKIAVRISIGVAGAKEHDPKDKDDFVDIADAGLYKAKNTGRNRVVIVNGKNRKQILMESP